MQINERKKKEKLEKIENQNTNLEKNIPQDKLNEKGLWITKMRKLKPFLKSKIALNKKK